MEFIRVLSVLILCFAVSEGSFLITYTMPFLCRNAESKAIAVGSMTNGFSSGILELTSYTYDSDCSAVLIPPTYSSAITISVKELDIGSGSNSVSFSDGQTSTTIYTYHFPSRLAVYTSKKPGARVTVTFKSNMYSYFNKGFKLVFTAFINGTSCKYDSFYQCDNGRCIDDDLVCDGNNHCGDSSDLDYCGPSPGAIAGYIFGSIFLIVACVCIVFGVVRRQRRTNVVAGATIIHPPPGNYPPANMTNPTAYPSYPTGYQQPPYAKYPEAPPPYTAPPQGGRDNPMYH